MRRFVLLLIFCCSAIVTAPALADMPRFVAADTALDVCTTQNPAFTTDDLSGITSPCAAPPGTLIIEMLYYQNASRVGGTALAAYPLVRLQTGIVRHLEVVLDTPSQVAESGLAGTGLYPTTHAGYGLNYTFASNARMAASAGVELVPPSSRFVVDQTQPKYMLTATIGYRAASRVTLSATVTGTSSGAVGFNRITPSAAVRLAYDFGAKTQVSWDIGARFVVRHAVAQSYGDIAVNQQLRKNLTFAVGLGTTFNPVSDAKAHYLASGFNLQVK
jgi:hypothetical protein